MTNLEKALRQLGYTNFRVIIDEELCAYTKTGVTTYAASSNEAELQFYNVVEWTLENGETSQSRNDFPVEYDVVGPVVELLMLREDRNKKLADCDWTQSRDVNLSNDSDWTTYRQSLRDITNTYTSIYNVVWPTEPS